MSSDIVILRSNIIHSPMKIISIDPAVKNIGFRVEERSYSGDECTAIRMIHFERISIDDDNNNMFVLLQQTLERLQDKCDNADLILIEKQQPISNRGQIHTNSKVMRVFGHIVGYYMTVARSSTIIEVSPKLKARVLGFPKNLTYAQTKSHGIKSGISLLEKHSDLMSLSVIKNAGSKKDDLTDTVCQIEAFMKSHFDFTKLVVY